MKKLAKRGYNILKIRVYLEKLPDQYEIKIEEVKEKGGTWKRKQKLSRTHMNEAYNKYHNENYSYKGLAKYLKDKYNIDVSYQTVRRAIKKKRKKKTYRIFFMYF